MLENAGRSPFIEIPDELVDGMKSVVSPCDD